MFFSSAKPWPRLASEDSTPSQAGTFTRHRALCKYSGNHIPNIPDHYYSPDKPNIHDNPKTILTVPDSPNLIANLTIPDNANIHNYPTFLSILPILMILTFLTNPNIPDNPNIADNPNFPNMPKISDDHNN